MGRPIRRSPTIEKGKKRSEAVCAINPKFDFGEGLTAAAYKAKLQEGSDKLNQYNSLLAQADAAGTELDVLEAQVANLNRRVLKGVASHYGDDSAEYGKAGGTRQSEIKRPARQPKTVKVAA
jgi:hypothetical protein